ncbi:hypothetical protein P154DRAFT_357817 [Amniculicola lignicola CBS 123094]|uniref:RelA/SpoT domain-containing protein n=1 Tax=Amniculicola lignicola CBS 123094 TaxID=1392246 RepID=A0A6A5WW19_9PLEO|nr:hypothetical protein P154DRAFT_357817 [Amniculicola lignicola CBS 123094]
MADVVDKFVEDWDERQYFWEALTEAAHTVCEDGVKKRLKLKCNIYSRTKSEESIRGSIERRQKSRGVTYTTMTEIEQDMIDLSGVRIILTFPGDVDEVKKLLESEFDGVHTSFWGLDENGNAVGREEKGRFIGYRATHFVVKWKKPDGKCRYRTKPKHVGRKIEIQVTSTAMYAWQQAHHDLVYKQLQGNPSEEERSLLEMINGLAHAGEMALTQLQTLSRRRIEEETRNFADEYEVGVWLKTHLKALLDFRSSIHAPFLERSAVLYDILLLSDLRTPAKVREVLTWPRDGLDRIGLDTKLEDILRMILSKEKNQITWAEAFRNDPADWAILRICAHHLAEHDTPRYKPLGVQKIQIARLKAFCFVNTINFALSEPLRHDFIKAVLCDVLSVYQNDDDQVAIRNLRALVTEKSNDAEAKGAGDPDQVYQQMELMWLNLLKCTVGKNSTFLCIALVLSLAGIVFLPQAEHTQFLDQQASLFIIWPFANEPEEPYQPRRMGQEVAAISNGQEPRKYRLDNLKWKIARISLDEIAQGYGWMPLMSDYMSSDSDPSPVFENLKPMTPHANIARPVMTSTPIHDKIEDEIWRIQKVRESPQSRANYMMDSSSPPRALASARHEHGDFAELYLSRLSRHRKSEEEEERYDGSVVPMNQKTPSL